jgi:mRNA-degrading endonuclease toxin of MazEF toxin-antitoxin module
MERKNKRHYAIERGRVFCIEPENKNEEQNLVVVISNKIHNRFANHIIVALVTDKNVEKARPSLEVPCQLEDKKVKVLISHIYSINKETFYKLEHYIGRFDSKCMQKIGKKIKMVLDLDTKNSL